MPTQWAERSGRSGFLAGGAMVTYNGKNYTLDRYGFLDPPEQWDEEFAQGLAAELGIHGGLHGEHWRFIYYLRDQFLEEKTVPVVFIAYKRNRMHLSRLRTLFPTGYLRGACRIAGLNFAFIVDANIWITFEGRPAQPEEHKVTEIGHLADFETWNERFAQRVAHEWDLPGGLTDRHWEILHFLRETYRDTKIVPTFYKTCRENDLDLEEFGRLFPAGYRRGACRAAGLPFA
jgi:tRNA 2-thiouridine synthesizing protein E